MKQDYLDVKKELAVGNRKLSFYSLRALQQKGYAISTLPFCIRVLAENVLRNYNGYEITSEHVETILNWTSRPAEKEIPFMPARVLMQDFTGVPAIVDIASLRGEMVRQGGDPSRINPLIPVDLVIDHSVQVDYYGNKDAYNRNVDKEYERNSERYRFLKWAQTAFDNFSVVPPGMGICHQVNLEYLSKCILERNGVAFPDSLVGTDSHTPMVNGLGIVAYGVGGIEAEAAMLGQPQFFAMPEVIGLKLTGKLPVGSTATDLVLTITELLRKTKVVGKFVEVFGDGLASLSVPDRATIGNMSPEFGCTITYFPIDDKTLQYLDKTNRPLEVIELTEAYAKENLLWHENEDKIQYSQVVELNLADIESTISGPSRPQDKILLRNAKNVITDIIEKKYFRKYIQHIDRPLSRWAGEGGNVAPSQVAEAEHQEMRTVKIEYNGEIFHLSDSDVVIAAITSCTNTSNPDVMIGAGLLAQKALVKGLNVKPWVKTSLAPGSKVVTDYLQESGLLTSLEAMKFNVVGYGCTSCIGNSGPLPEPIAKAIADHDLIVAATLSSNRNFEARIHPQVKMNFLMSPLLVVAYAIAGRTDIDMITEPLGVDKDNKPVFLKDIWPTPNEITEMVNRVVKKEYYKKNYDEIFEGNAQWQNLVASTDKAYKWEATSTYVKEAPFFQNLSPEPAPIQPIANARVLLMLGDSITTDHISPAGSFSALTPAGKYLLDQGVPVDEFNSYGSRRGNDEVMLRGTFANVRIKNKLATKEGGFTTHLPSGEEMTVYEASVHYKESKTSLLILAGKEYGSGSSRDWAAKGTYLLGVRAVIAESYERIHRSNLVGMGVLPLQFIAGENSESLGLDGTETFTIGGLNSSILPSQILNVTAENARGMLKNFSVVSRLDSKIEIDYYRNGGILQYMLRQFLKKDAGVKKLTDAGRPGSVFK
jgi:aconitate hydratase